jgi:hypothetical protein
MCLTSWEHEVGETNVELYSSPKQHNHIGCGLIAVNITAGRVIKKDDWTLPGATIPAARMQHEQLKSIRAEIRKLKYFYERVKNQGRRPWKGRK